jgi:cell division GTPase FtsZ
MASKEHALSIAVVGLGKGGGRIADELARRGYEALTFHTARRAADELLHVPTDRRHVLGAERDGGTGGDPEVGRRRIEENARRVEDLVRTGARDADLVLVTACLGGGTGSAVAELVDAIDGALEKGASSKVVVLATLPGDGESADRKARALEAVRDLTGAELAGLVLVDNARLHELASDVSILEVRDRINERLVDPIDALNRIDDALHAVRELGATRLAQVLSAGGIVVLGAQEVRELTPEHIGQAVRDELEASWVYASGIDPSAISAMQLVIEAPKSVLASTPIRLVDHLREHWKTETSGASVEVSIYRNDDARAPVVRMIASSAAIPDRVTQLVSDTAAERLASRQKARRPPELDLSALDPGAELSASARPRTPARRVSDVAPRAQPNHSASLGANHSASLGASAGLGARPVATEVGPEPEAPARAADEGSDGGSDAEGVDAQDTRASRAVYARLVTRYKSTSNDELQRAIARRLEQDRLSEDPHVRYLAVDAMGKIGAHVFDASLVAATEDESPAVRNAAEKAMSNGSPTLAFGS